MRFNTSPRLRLLCTLCIFEAVKASESCPDYGDIRQPSVDPTVFNISDFAGTWYMVATTEPTLPAFCTCTRNEVSVHLPEGWYAYTAHTVCEGKFPISVPLKGKLSEDPRSPGLLHENFGLFNHTMPSLDPNMIFEARYDEQGRMQLAITYACLGRMLPLPPLGQPKFSFNILSRTTAWTKKELQDLVANVTSATRGLLDTSKIRFADQAVYDSCSQAIIV
ncbi:unnamed protein product [Symbiodinium natans]|uniref:Lipocalin/cytosolic fatty-acid binding domain-containing protein n=1 Tax=Symbiodinium natans TaxID=878477 RepID=A0A812KZ62_9DINO|nr:unnamed protein product [Symbiodinium natans]